MFKSKKVQCQYCKTMMKKSYMHVVDIGIYTKDEIFLCPSCFKRRYIHDVPNIVIARGTFD
jgi:hypothetical protein